MAGDTIIFRDTQISSRAVYQCNTSNEHGYLLANAFVSVLGECTPRLSPSGEPPWGSLTSWCSLFFRGQPGRWGKSGGVGEAWTLKMNFLERMGDFKSMELDVWTVSSILEVGLELLPSPDGGAGPGGGGGSPILPSPLSKSILPMFSVASG